MKLLSIVVVAWAVIGSAYGQTTVNGVDAVPGSLIFSDDFDKLDFTVWQHEKTMSGGGNWEFQVYDNSRSNSFTKDSILHIKPTLTEDRYGAGFVNTGTLDLNGGAPADECTNPSFYGCSRGGGNTINPAMAARIRTVNSFSFKYGRVEVNAKMPTGDWLWPAIWMLPRHNAYGTWPASGEIDLVESRGNLRLMQNGVNIGVEQAGQTLHWGPYWPYNGYGNTAWTKSSTPGYNSAFHRYQLEWTPDYLKFSIDDVETGRITPGAGGFWDLGVSTGAFPAEIENPWRFATKMAPFDEEFYLIINLAVGGTNGFFPDDAVNEGGAPKPWTSTSGNALGDFWNGRAGWYPTWQAAGEEAAIQVDYVRVWAL
ncbi:beta-1,3-glucan-binding protein-like [Daphnia pulicaria]|uniref:beta-1,3-glucan-binding protein-like n=1 Tax=Daphnia pulicaria TaxID=35523 RepID=UPI001EE9AF23|nr:beta-1,3-glucan-binding protein-like [Daphnia pulicaria]